MSGFRHWAQKIDASYREIASSKWEIECNRGDCHLKLKKRDDNTIEVEASYDRFTIEEVEREPEMFTREDGALKLPFLGRLLVWPDEGEPHLATR